ncbi:unnamed protein product [Schistocephalus solidus]|uniref:Transcription initiation factor IIA subunit 2 n=1 Tax=Schistocephalus solidus TaxID=70667 RepID=A0A183SV36_SCHSO|nr:unnamed protein product [Schistocephalus solidus]
MSTETYHEMYRRTTLGNTLQESLDEMLTHNLITSGCAMKVCFSHNNSLSKRVKNRLFLKGHLNTYRNCDNVWTLVMNDVEIRDASVLLHVDKVRHLCDLYCFELPFCTLLVTSFRAISFPRYYLGWNC